jgi:hypothetical protein
LTHTYTTKGSEGVASEKAKKFLEFSAVIDQTRKSKTWGRIMARPLNKK